MAKCLTNWVSPWVQCPIPHERTRARARARAESKRGKGEKLRGEGVVEEEEGVRREAGEEDKGRRLKSGKERNKEGVNHQKQRSSLHNKSPGNGAVRIFQPCKDRHQHKGLAQQFGTKQCFLCS